MANKFRIRVNGVLKDIDLAKIIVRTEDFKLVDINGQQFQISATVQSSTSDLNLTNSFWIKIIDSTTHQLKYGTVTVLVFNPATGNLRLEGLLDDVEALIAANEALINARASVVQGPNIACNSNTTFTIDIDDGIWQKLTFTSDCTLAFTIPTGEVHSMILEMVNAGAYNITWPAGIKYPNGTPLDLSIVGTDHVVVYKDGANQLYTTLIAQDVRTA